MWDESTVLNIPIELLTGVLVTNRGVSKLYFDRAPKNKLSDLYNYREEYNRFVELRYQARRRYNNIMQSLADTKRSWSDLKKACELLEGRNLADKILNDLLSNLCDAGFVVKDDGNYNIADPLVRAAVQNKLIK